MTDADTVERIEKALGITVMCERGLTPQAIRVLVKYGPQTGLFEWMPRPHDMFHCKGYGKYWNKRYAGKPAFTSQNSHGYLHSPVLTISQMAHRAAWAIVNGAWPDDAIDHINGQRADNRWENLRPATARENSLNQGLSRLNKSGVLGVRRSKRYGTWSAVIGNDGRKKHLGTFPTKAEAVRARRQAEVELGYHENHGRPFVGDKA